MPHQIGWYMVKWEPSDSLVLVYVCYIGENGLSWKYYEGDDPEFLTYETMIENNTVWKQASEYNVRENLIF